MLPCQGRGRGFKSLPPLMKDKTQIVFSYLQKIPKGKVTTYKILAQKTGIKNPRTVGTIIHKNTDTKKYPCHRVVRSDGTIAEGYAFGGKNAQIEILKKESVNFKGKKVDLVNHLFTL